MLFADRIEVRNPGRLPTPLTLEKLREAYSSVPGNPLLAESLYLTEYIERMGTGTLDMIRRCVEAGLPEPEFAVTDGFVTTIRQIAIPGRAPGRGMEQGAGSVGRRPESDEVRGRAGGHAGIREGQVGSQAALSEKEVAMLHACRAGAVSAEALMAATGHSSRTGSFRRWLDLLAYQGFLEMTIPDTPRSPTQRYRLTDKGRAALGRIAESDEGFDA